MPNIKLGNDTLNGVNTVRLQKADGGSYESFGANTVQHADISNDIKAKVLDIVQKVQAKRQNDSIVFVAASDAHQLESDMDIVGGNLHAGQAMECLSYVIPGIDFCCYLGDYTCGSSTTTIAEGRRHFEDINDDIDGAFRGIPQFRTLGNHDSLRYSEAQNGSILSEAELYQFCGSYNKDNVNGTALAGYCYRDFDAKKCRVICLNTAENTEKEFVSDTQKLWFANALKAVGAKTGWNVIILSHHPPDWGNVCTLSNIVNAYDTGTSISIGGTSIDFAGSNSAKILAAFHGHTHCFKAAKLNKISSGVGTE